MALEHTLTQNQKVRLPQHYSVLTGADDALVPQLLRVDEDHNLRVTNKLGGLAIPAYRSIELTYYGATNNIATATYKDADDATVAVLELFYGDDPPIVNDANLTLVRRTA